VNNKVNITNNIMEEQDLLCDSHCLKTKILLCPVSVSVYMVFHLSVLSRTIFLVIIVVLLISHAHRLLLSPEV